MLSAILTWIGAILGMTVLLAMAFGAFVLDFSDARSGKRTEGAEAPEVPLRTDSA